jgi:hypothetical protein
LLDKSLTQLAPISGLESGIIFDRVMHPEKLAADFFVLLEHQRVEAQLVAPARGRKSGRTGADDQHVMHRRRISPPRHVQHRNEIGKALTCSTGFG